jgi:hypothetical protein
MLFSNCYSRNLSRNMRTEGNSPVFPGRVAADLATIVIDAIALKQSSIKVVAHFVATTDQMILVVIMWEEAKSDSCKVQVATVANRTICKAFTVEEDWNFARALRGRSICPRTRDRM